ncbi:MAG: hypothetical protein J6K70_00615 [Selenomonadales bacterium]|nr:hypothetical protein [Selenomonadales bacterium]
MEKAMVFNLSVLHNKNSVARNEKKSKIVCAAAYRCEKGGTRYETKDEHKT